MLDRSNDLFHFFPKHFEEDFFFVSEEIVDIGGPTAIGNADIAHTCGLVAFFPEKPSRYFQHLRFLKTGFNFSSCHHHKPNNCPEMGALQKGDEAGKESRRVTLMNGH
jgi:hypothetical protein